jgi:hypothetical protein
MDASDLAFLLVVFLLRCLPGIFVGALGWLVTGRMSNKWAQVIFRGLLLALAITPTGAGHAGLIPAAWFFFADPHLWFVDSDLLVFGLLPLLIVWSLSIPVIFALTRRSGKKKL